MRTSHINPSSRTTAVADRRKVRREQEQRWRRKSTKEERRRKEGANIRRERASSCHDGLRSGIERVEEAGERGGQRGAGDHDRMFRGVWRHIVWL